MTLVSRNPTAAADCFTLINAAADQIWATADKPDSKTIILDNLSASYWLHVNTNLAEWKNLNTPIATDLRPFYRFPVGFVWLFNLNPNKILFKVKHRIR